ncbi:MAG: hypothetical protein HYZ30_01575 [Candidatus Azosocius agrarius]|nr:MAG: hypothetical protein HYZ30_01575 [Gammaproteobacteria bacterium]
MIKNNIIIINKKDLPLACPKEKNLQGIHPRIFLNTSQPVCKYCSTTYIIK